MTAAVIICVAGGVVLAADSRSSICEDTTRGRRVLTTHDGAQKIVTWGRALGAVCVGAGSIGGLPLDGLLRKALSTSVTAMPRIARPATISAMRLCLGFMDLHSDQA